MKRFPIAVIISAFLGLVSFGSTAHGIWVPESTQDLLEKSDTIFVGNITATKTLQFEKHYSYLEEVNGTDKNITKNYTVSLDEYTVYVEKYLKNPQNLTKITVREPTIGIMGRLGGLGGFKTGDHVLFYVTKIDGNNTYSPESFVLPTFCNGKDVLTQERPEGGINFTTVQNGVKVGYGNFAANEPVRFISSKDMGTLSGKSYDLEVSITRNSGGNAETVFNKEIHSSSKPCRWVAAAEWEFTPKEGNYRMTVTEREGGIITGVSGTGFSARYDTTHAAQTSPLGQFRSGIAANDVKCEKGFSLVLRAEDRAPACVRPYSIKALVERGWVFPGNNIVAMTGSGSNGQHMSAPYFHALSCLNPALRYCQQDIQPGKTADGTQAPASTFRVIGGSGSGSFSSRHSPTSYFNETETYTISVGKVMPGYPVQVTISDPSRPGPRTETIPAGSIMPNGTFHYKINVTGKLGVDEYTIIFAYGNQSLKIVLPAVPPW